MQTSSWKPGERRRPPRCLHPRRQRLSSLLLTLAEHGPYEPRWSEPILTETERALIQKLHVGPDLARRRLQAMRVAFPEASVVGFDDLIPGLPRPFFRADVNS